MTKAIMALICIMLYTGIARADDFDVTSFKSDFKTYKVGDVAPDLFFTHDYIIRGWKVRHLPRPGKGFHWSWMNGTYVLLRESDHVITMAKSADIFYKRDF